MTKEEKKKKKRKFAVIRLIILLVLLAAIAFGAVKLFGGKEPVAEEKTSTAYIGADLGESVSLYTKEETVIKKNLFGKVTESEIKYNEAETLVRGTEVLQYENSDTDEEGNVTYDKVQYNGAVYYVKPGHLVSDVQSAIFEKERYVRTDVTIYEDATSPKIAGFAAKGNKLTVIGYDELDENGDVEMYKVSFGDTTGYVYAKYLVGTQEEADAVYNELCGEVNCADFHKDAVYPYFDLYGGDPSNLDYYPYEKPVFEDNVMPSDVRAMYIVGDGLFYADNYIEVAKAYDINAVCINIVDGINTTQFECAKEYSPSNYANYIMDTETFKTAVQKFLDAGLYVIGRIVVFNDGFYAADHPENCIIVDGEANWPTVYSREVWEYKVSMAVECVEKYGFNEIQFDYVRFPEGAYGMSENPTTDFKNTYGEDKAEAVQNFLFYACDMVHRAGAYVSVDVFGESSYGYVTSYGQYWPAMSNIVDAISGMPYLDHFTGSGDDSQSDWWVNEYDTVTYWARTAAKLQETIPTPAAARTWLTGYDVPYWSGAYEMTAEKLASQAQALWDCGLTGGFLTWNGISDINHYIQWSWAWSKDYSIN